MIIVKKKKIVQYVKYSDIDFDEITKYLNNDIKNIIYEFLSPIIKYYLLSKQLFFLYDKSIIKCYLHKIYLNEFQKIEIKSKIFDDISTFSLRSNNYFVLEKIDFRNMNFTIYYTYDNMTKKKKSLKKKINKKFLNDFLYRDNSIFKQYKL